MDSFLDIVTNTLGLLILIAALTIITTRDIKISLGTPMMAPAPKAKTRVMFECRGNRIIPIEEDYCEDEMKDIIESEAPVWRRKQMVRELNDRRITDGYYRFAYDALPLRTVSDNREVIYPALTLRPLEGKLGDTISMLRDPQAEYNKRLSDLDPDEHWLCFIARKDSFEALRVARKIARKQGFQVGWDPLQSDTKISFSPPVPRRPGTPRKGGTVEGIR